MSATAQARYKVGGMDCASCATKIDTAVRRMPGVEDVSVSVASGTMTVKHDGTGDLVAIEKKVVGLGYSLRALGQKAPAKVGGRGDGAAEFLLPGGEKVPAKRPDEGAKATVTNMARVVATTTTIMTEVMITRITITTAVRPKSKACTATIMGRRTGRGGNRPRAA